MESQSELAERFRSLHHAAHLLILPNAWDVPSARIFEESGFPAVATSSAGLMVSQGYPDGQGMPRREMISLVAKLASRLSIPLSADVVAGYGRGPREVVSTVAKIVGAGAVGINIEDSDHARGQLYRTGTQVAKLRALRELRDSGSVRFVINARTDAFQLSSGEVPQRLNEVLHRLEAYRDAGADCVYPMGVTDPASISTVVKALNFPVNVMVRKGLPSVPELESIGVKRVSFGPYASYAALGLLKQASEEVLQRGTYGALVDHAITYDELNRLATRRTS